VTFPLRFPRPAFGLPNGGIRPAATAGPEPSPPEKPRAKDLDAA